MSQLAVGSCRRRFKCGDNVVAGYSELASKLISALRASIELDLSEAGEREVDTYIRAVFAFPEE